MSRGSGTSSEHASLHTPEYWRVSNRILSASRSTASCSSPNELTQAVFPHDAVLTLKAMVLRGESGGERERQPAGPETR